MIGAIPAPPFDAIGPLNVYGLMIALGVVAAVWLMGRRFEERGVGTTDDASSIALGAVLAGVIGARLYHVVTDWDRFSDDLGAIPAIWKGGLGIPGGLLAGIPVGLFLARRRGISIDVAATCAAPAIALAQAIGRWGNYFNQELYGSPTDLPWALRVDPEHLVIDPDTGQRFEIGTTFHPTFLYESLWSLALCGLLLVIDRRFRPGGGSLMGLYVAGYGLGRFWVEGLRVDPADVVGGLRWNQWVAAAAVIGGSLAALELAKRAERRDHADPTGDDAVELTDDRIDDDPDEVETRGDELHDDGVIVDDDPNDEPDDSDPSDDLAADDSGEPDEKNTDGFDADGFDADGFGDDGFDDDESGDDVGSVDRRSPSSARRRRR